MHGGRPHPPCSFDAAGDGAPDGTLLGTTPWTGGRTARGARELLTCAEAKGVLL